METETLRFMVQAWECDHLGHVNVRSYMGWLADAAFALVALSAVVVRTLRSSLLEVLQSEYVEAARSLAAGSGTI